MNINKCFLAGNLTADPETKQGKKEPFVTFSIAIDGRNQDVTFANCVAFGKTGELIAKYFTKGKPIFVEATYTTRKSKQGNWFHGFAVNSFQFVGPQTDKKETKKEADDIPF